MIFQLYYNMPIMYMFFILRSKVISHFNSVFNPKQIKCPDTIQIHDFIKFVYYTPINITVNFISIYKLGNIFPNNVPIYHINKQNIYHIPNKHIVAGPRLL